MALFDMKTIPAPWRGEGATMKVVDVGKVGWVPGPSDIGTMTSYGIWWSPVKEGGGGHNTYVLVRSDTGPYVAPSGERVRLLSINGGGEVRWSVEPYSALNSPGTGFGGEGAFAAFELEVYDVNA
jgi:hypothetical protein